MPITRIEKDTDDPVRNTVGMCPGSQNVGLRKNSRTDQWILSAGNKSSLQCRFVLIMGGQQLVVASGSNVSRSTKPLLHHVS
jgi:hypothetical protein